MDFKIIKYLIIFLLIQFNSQAIEFEGKFIQGHFILGKTDPRAKIQIDKKSVRVSKDGFFAFGLGRDRKNDVVITETLNGVKNQFVKKTNTIPNIIAVSAKNKLKKRKFKIPKSKWVKNYLDITKNKNVDIIVELIGGSEGPAKKLIFSAS